MLWKVLYKISIHQFIMMKKIIFLKIGLQTALNTRSILTAIIFNYMLLSPLCRSKRKTFSYIFQYQTVAINPQKRPLFFKSFARSFF